MPLRVDLLSVTGIVEDGRLVEVLDSREKVEVSLGPSGGNVEPSAESSRDPNDAAS